MYDYHEILNQFLELNLISELVFIPIRSLFVKYMYMKDASNKRNIGCWLMAVGTIYDLFFVIFSCSN